MISLAVSHPTSLSSHLLPLSSGGSEVVESLGGDVAASLCTADVTSDILVIGGATAERSCCLSFLLSLIPGFQFLGQPPEMLILGLMIYEL